MSTIYLIRHGQASFGKGDYDKLSEKGVVQSRITGEFLIEAGVKFDRIYTGTMVRHLETFNEYADILKANSLAGPETSNTPDLNEYDSKQILTTLVPELIDESDSWKEHLSKIYTDKKSFQLIFEETLARWTAGRYKNTGIATWNEYLSRVNRSIDDILKNHGRGKNIAVFTSGGTIAAFIRRALNLSNEDTLRATWQIVNCSITRFKCTETSLMMATFNEHGHLEICKEKNMITYR
ncbi:MAG TPA: histidine phosphatase family protein [Spirochaetota bacterium]|nr:histidine phosphatase family protein [Spirochaetota bacterium]